MSETPPMGADEVMRLAKRFVEVANTLKQEGVESHVISTVMMVATGIYTTYAVAGNQGYLQPAGVDKITAAFRRNLENLQDIKRGLAEQQEKAGS